MHRTNRVKIEENIALVWGTAETRIEKEDTISWEKMIQKPSLNDMKGLTNIKQCQDRSFTSKSRIREFMMAEIEDFKGNILLSSIFYIYFVFSTKL